MNKYFPEDALDILLPFFTFSLLFSVTAIEVSLLAASAVVLYRARLGGGLKPVWPALKNHRLFLPWAAFVGVCLLTALTAHLPAKGLSQVNSDLLRYVCFATLMLAVRERYFRGISWAYISSAAVCGFIGIGQVLKVFPISRPPLELRAGAFMNPVRYGEVMALATAFIAAKLLYGENNSRRENLLYSAAGVLSFAGLVLSQTRGAYLGFAVFMTLVFVLGKGVRLRAVWLSLAMVVVAAACSRINATVATRFTVVENKPGQGEVVEEGASLRLQLWQVGWEMFKDHPVLGIGPDNVKPLFKQYKPDLIGNATWGSMHNLYLQHAAERGIIGLAALLFLFGSFAVYALRNFLQAPGQYTLWAACVLPGYFAMNLTENSFQHVHTSFAALLALALSAASAAEKKV